MKPAKPKIKVGQVWRTRGGDIVTITRIDPYPYEYPVVTDLNRTYTPDGMWLWGTGLCPYDLVELVRDVTEPSDAVAESGDKPKIALGYIGSNRLNQRVEVVAVRPDRQSDDPKRSGKTLLCVVDGSKGPFSTWLYPDGKFYNNGKDHDNDIISEFIPIQKCHVYVRKGGGISGYNLDGISQINDISVIELSYRMVDGKPTQIKAKLLEQQAKDDHSMDAIHYAGNPLDKGPYT